MGATLSASAMASDIAAQIVAVVDQFVAGNTGDSIPDITPLTAADIRINEAVVQGLGLKSASAQPAVAAEAMN
jgi:hypothetical protein